MQLVYQNIHDQSTVIIVTPFNQENIWVYNINNKYIRHIYSNIQDNYSQPFIVELTELCAVPGRQEFECTYSVIQRYLLCVHLMHGGDVESRFGTGNHTVVVTVVDVFGQSLRLVSGF